MSGDDARARRKANKRGRARDRAAFVESRRGAFDRRRLDEALASYLAAAAPADGVAGILPTTDVNRWVPIGPSVVRRGQAEGRPRVTGRVRDVAVSDDGARAYAATAKGGVWYTGDGGATWDPVGGWADRTSRAGANAQACGCLLVSFGAAVAQDYVMVGTGETQPWIAPTGHSQFGGVGVLAGLGPAAPAAAAQPWERDEGIAQLAGLGIFRMARHPASTPCAASGAAVDRVVAATSAGLFLGTRGPIAGPPARDGFTWVQVVALDAHIGGVVRPITDAIWLPGGADGRLIVAVRTRGVAFSDDAGAHWTWVTNLGSAAAPFPAIGRLSLARPSGTRVYVLGEQVAGTPTVWQIPDVSVAAPAAAVVANVPAALFGTQRDYDQAIAAETVGGNDRLYLGGSTVQAAPNGAWSASLWCLETPVPPAAAALVPAPQISTTGVPPGAGADQAGLIGNNVHADVHAIRLTGAPGPNRQVWVGCDGGVFVSAQAGRCNSFLSRSTGVASLEVGFHAPHPTSSHFVAIGCQDNGTQVRVGDTVWEETMQGDGGGVAFHPLQSQFLVAQYIQGTWLGRPSGPYRDPLHRATGGTYEGTPADREWGVSAFYSGAASVRLSASVGRIAVGTERVWLTDNLGTAAANSWRVLPAPPGGPAVDPRPGGADPAAQQATGVPPGALGGVIQLRWAGDRELLALYAQGLVRYTQNPISGAWSTTVLIPGIASAPSPASTTLTDICPLPGTQDFYLTTTGETAGAAIETCWFFDAATATFSATNLRHVLDALDPAYAVAIDPSSPTDVYVGTVTGVWHGVRTPGVANHAWTFFANGLPQATVQDLGFWTDAAGDAGAPRLLRAAIQSRGLWEVNLAAAEARRTYVRVHPRDDRRRFPTPLQNPRRSPSAPLEPTFASPDVVVRPAPGPAVAPTWQLPAAARINASNAPTYQLWTFQTAFRWHYPSILADGQWSDQLGDLVRLHRSVLALSAGDFIDRALWDAVVRGTRLTPAGAISASPADPFAVYRAPWQSASSLTAPATEVDLLELVVPRSVVNHVWQVFREPSIADVLLHHRDTRPVLPSDAFAVVLFRSAATQSALLSVDPTPLPPFAQSLLGGAPLPVPPGWTLAVPAAGGSLHRLPVALDARMPRAVPVPVDLSAVTAGHRVLILAMVGSSIDGFTAPVSGAPANMSDLVRRWPHAAMRLVRVSRRPP